MLLLSPPIKSVVGPVELRGSGEILSPHPHIFTTGNSKTCYSIAESFYYVKYGPSIIISLILSKILTNENKKNCVPRKIVCFGILIHVLS